MVPIPCKPCEINSNIFRYDCDLQVVECGKYPWYNSGTLVNFNGVLGYVMNDYLINNGHLLNDCQLNSLNTEWFVDININNNLLIHNTFFNGVGYIDSSLSSPSISDWDNALIIALNDLKNYGYDYYFTNNDTVVIYNLICSTSDVGLNFKLNVGINFNITCD